jgi:membrane-bound serine protease (ClpP class)
MTSRSKRALSGPLPATTGCDDGRMTVEDIQIGKNRVGMMRLFSLLIFVGLFLSNSLAFGSTIHSLTVEGVINPTTALYLQRGLDKAHAQEAQAVLLKLNTPGGLESSMREMVQGILNSRIPVIVYVTPPGGRAASAGMFIVMAANVAAMAPGTNIGAAHPVALGGGDQAQGDDQPMVAKAVNDASALARSIANERNRNAEWAERAVREAISATAEEAKRLRVIDLVEPTQESLLAELDGQSLEVAGATVTLETAGAEIVEVPMNWAERILHAVTDPNVAYLLMSIGFIGILAELYSPGLLFPGLTGVISLVVAFTAMGSLPISWAGVFLLALAFLLWALELQSEGLGVFAAAGLVSFVLGSLMLYRPLEPVSPALPAVQVSLWLVAVMSLMIGVFFIFVARELIRSRHRPLAMGPSALLGTKGLALSDFDQMHTGTVRLDSEEWSARVEGADLPVHAGEPVEVTGVEGVTLKVRPVDPTRSRPAETT